MQGGLKLLHMIAGSFKCMVVLVLKTNILLFCSLSG